MNQYKNRQVIAQKIDTKSKKNARNIEVIAKRIENESTEISIKMTKIAQ